MAAPSNDASSSTVEALLRGGPRCDYPGLDGFFMAGHCVESWGGITTAALSGRNAMRTLRRKDSGRFAARRGATGR